MLNVKKFIFSPFYENTYLVYDDISKETAVIDPGCYDDKERKTLDDFVKQENLLIKYLINTHCHIDHIFGNAFIKTNFNPQYLAPQEDLFLLDLMIKQGEIYGTPLTPSPQPDLLITEDEIINLGNSSSKFIFVPGHSPGGYSLYFENEKICFTGDTLFKGSIGRTDLWGGDYNTLIKSINEKLLVLPDDVKIFPGHESDSTIGYERKNNQFLI